MSKFNVLNGIGIRTSQVFTFNMLENAVDNLKGTKLSSSITCVLKHLGRDELYTDLMYLSHCHESAAEIIFPSCNVTERTDYQEFHLRSSLVKNKNKVVEVFAKNPLVPFNVIGVHVSKYDNARVHDSDGDNMNPIIVFEIIDAALIQLFEDFAGPHL